jgi:hypothetical protein
MKLKFPRGSSEVSRGSSAPPSSPGGSTTTGDIDQWNACEVSFISFWHSFYTRVCVFIEDRDGQVKSFLTWIKSSQVKSDLTWLDLTWRYFELGMTWLEVFQKWLDLTCDLVKITSQVKSKRITYKLLMHFNFCL